MLPQHEQMFTKLTKNKYKREKKFTVNRLGLMSKLSLRAQYDNHRQPTSFFTNYFKHLFHE